jgi:hypothetical protein
VRARNVLVVALGLLVAGALVAGYLLLTKVPRPSLPYPEGQSLKAVRGNCWHGNELLGCDTNKGPRSFLTVRASGDQRAAAERLFAALLADGWSKDDTGSTAQDFAGGGAPEDIQPLYCKDGCVGLFRFETDGYVLAWFDS